MPPTLFVLVVGLAALGLSLGPLLTNLGYLQLSKARLSSGLPVEPAVAYTVVSGGDPLRLAWAKRYFDLALRLNPSNSLALAGLARVNTLDGQFDAAIATWHAAQAAGYSRAQGDLLLGNLYAHLADRPAALRHWEQAVPATAPAWLHLSRALIAQGRGTYDPERWGDAVQVLEDALRDLPLTVPEQISLHQAASDIYASLRQHERGLAHAEQAARLDPTSASGYAWLAWYLHVNLGDTARARVEADQALAAAPDWRAYLVVGDDHLARCELPAAMQAYQSGLSLPAGGDWRHVLLLLGLASAHWEAGDSQAALAAWQRAAALQPGLPDAPQALAEVAAGARPRHCAESSPA
jgi:tetratricopeptide (TPR) repeat protein